MGNSIQTTQYETIVLNSGSNILFDATQHRFNIATIKLEAGTQGRKIQIVLSLKILVDPFFLKKVL